MMASSWRHGTLTVRRIDPRPARRRRRGRRRRRSRAREAPRRPARRGDPPRPPGRPRRGRRGDHGGAGSRLRGAAAPRSRAAVRRDPTPVGPVRRGAGRGRRRAAALGRGRRRDRPHQPPDAREPQGPRRAGRGRRGPVCERLARPGGRRPPRPRRGTGAPGDPHLVRHAALPGVGAMSGLPADPRRTDPPRMDPPRRKGTDMETFETPDPITVDVEVNAGDLQLDAGDRTDTTVEIRPSDPSKKGDVAAAEQTRVEFANGHLSVKTPKIGWKQWVSLKGECVDVRIALPAGSRVRADTGAGTVRSTGHLGDSRFKTGAGNVHLGEFDALEVKTGAGDIAVERAGGTTQLATGTGDVRMGAIDGAAAVKNSNGDTWIREVTGEVRINAANGDITIERAGGGVVAKTARGDVRLTDVSRGAS